MATVIFKSSTPSFHSLGYSHTYPHITNTTTILTLPYPTIPYPYLPTDHSRIEINDVPTPMTPTYTATTMPYSQHRGSLNIWPVAARRVRVSFRSNRRLANLLTSRFERAYHHYQLQKARLVGWEPLKSLDPRHVSEQ